MVLASVPTNSIADQICSSPSSNCFCASSGRFSTGWPSCSSSCCVAFSLKSSFRSPRPSSLDNSFQMPWPFIVSFNFTGSLLRGFLGRSSISMSSTNSTMTRASATTIGAASRGLSTMSIGSERVNVISGYLGGTRIHSSMSINGSPSGTGGISSRAQAESSISMTMVSPGGISFRIG